ncbi:acetyltransferase [Robiginitalea sp. IMCC44478]|uniref:acetyltransferase n=1 Tax=Robiginitalea sp. IMCC44478 TaxID=3459122 RepID=UPI00404240C5
MKLKNIIIFGASGHGSVVLDCLEKDSKYKPLGFIDSYKKKGTKKDGYEVLGSEYDLPYLIEKFNIHGGIVAIGDNWARSRMVRRIKKIVPNFTFVSTTHPSAVIGKGVHISSGTVIMPGVIVNANSHIGPHCILNTKASLDHDGWMGAYSSLAPGCCIGGNFHLGEYSAICLGTNIIENITIEEHSVVGSSSLVLKNFPSFIVAYGRPARIIGNRKKGDPYLSGSKLDTEVLASED